MVAMTPLIAIQLLGLIFGYLDIVFVLYGNDDLYRIERIGFEIFGDVGI